jgi:dTDP-4-dehydrorhamnose 3,5-epimerase
MLRGRKDKKLVDADWSPSGQPAIDGVSFKLIANVLGEKTRLTEVWRRDWKLDDRPVEQVFQGVLPPGTVSAWHAHATTMDRLFCALGRIKVVLYDGRDGSPTLGNVVELHIGEERPMLVVVPPGVWHGVKCVSPHAALLINLVDVAYDYDDPDHWRLPADCPDIPYRIA